MRHSRVPAAPEWLARRVTIFYDATKHEVWNFAHGIAHLGSDDFEPRQQAADSLDRLGEAAGPAQRKAIAANPPLEARRRMEALLKKLTPAVLPPETLRVIRAVQVLEGIGSAEAQQLMQELARGAAGVG